MDRENKITVLDFGGQYAHLIAKRVRHLGIYADIMHPDVTIDALGKPGGIILSGGPSSVYSDKAPPFNHEILNSGIPILGLCYGMQLLANLLGGEVKRLERHEYGRAELEVAGESPLFSGLTSYEQVWMSHGDSVISPPEGFDIIGSTSDCPVAAIGNEERKLYGLQFHPEVKDTPSGDRIIGNFLKICGLEKNWSMEGYIDEKMKEIRERVGNRESRVDRRCDNHGRHDRQGVDATAATDDQAHVIGAGCGVGVQGVRQRALVSVSEIPLPGSDVVERLVAEAHVEGRATGGRREAECGDRRRLIAQ